MKTGNQEPVAIGAGTQGGNGGWGALLRSILSAWGGGKRAADRCCRECSTA